MDHRSERAAVHSLLKNVLFKMSERHLEKATVIRVAMGEMAGLDRATLEACWLELSKGTPVEQAQLQFRSIVTEVQCMSCFEKYHPVNNAIHCPYCGGFGAKILGGEEFYLESIE